MLIGKFNPQHTKSIPLDRSIEDSTQFLLSGRGPAKQNLVEIHPLEASGQMGEIQQKWFYLFISTFFEICQQVKPVDGFLRVIAQKTQNHAQPSPLFQNTLKYATTQPYGKVYFFEADRIKFLTVKQSEGSQANFHPPHKINTPGLINRRFCTVSFVCERTR